MGWMACVAVIVSGVGGADTKGRVLKYLFVKIILITNMSFLEVENIDVPTIYIVYVSYIYN